MRAAIVCTLALGVATQTALRSVPSLVFNGDTGMAAELGYSNSDRGAILSAFGNAIFDAVLSAKFGPILSAQWNAILFAFWNAIVDAKF